MSGLNGDGRSKILSTIRSVFAFWVTYIYIYFFFFLQLIFKVCRGIVGERRVGIMNYYILVSIKKKFNS